jgi:hypothetical protein
MNNPGLKFLVTTLALTCYISPVAAQNRASVDVRKTDHTLVWPLDFFEINRLFDIRTNSGPVTQNYRIWQNNLFLTNGMSLRIMANGVLK